MPIPESINDLSEIPEENSPQGGENIGGTLDDFLRAFQAIMKRDLALKKAETATGTNFKPAGGLVAKNVQAAIEELKSSGAPKEHKHPWGDVTDKPNLLKITNSYVTWDNQGDVLEFNTKNHISVFRGRHNGDMNWYVGTGASNSYDVYLSSYKHSTTLILRNEYAEFNRPMRVTPNGVNTWSSIQLGTTHGYWIIEASPNSHLPGDQRLNFKFVNTRDNTQTYLRFPTTNNQEQDVAYQSWVDSRISANINTKIVPADTNNRDRGIYGTYDAAKIAHVWSMGISYKIPANGANFGNLYGMAYKHSNNTTGGNMAGGHQIVFVNNGTPGVSIGLDGNVWTKGQFMGSGAGLTNVPWGGVSGKPTTFPPSTHTHPWSQITGVPVQATRWPNAGEQGYTQSLSAAGWCKLPNGLILQWVKGSKATKVNWPIAFKTIFLAVDSHLATGSGNFDTDLFYDNVGVWGRYQNEFRVIGIGI